MKVIFKEQFTKDLLKINNILINKLVEESIVNVENAPNLHNIEKLGKLKGYKTVYRIKLGDYRIGVVILNNTITFSRILHRKDIYKKFP